MTHLKAGDTAPDFKGIIQDESEVSLADYKGSKLVLYFYPKDNTPGCTTQACNLRDNYDELLKQGYKVLGVSPDSAKKHQNFIAKKELPFDQNYHQIDGIVKLSEIPGFKTCKRPIKRISN